MNWKKVLIGKLSFKRLIRSIVVLYCLANIMVYFYAEKLIFPYDQSSYNRTLSGLQLLKSKDNTDIAIRHWQANKEKNLVLYFHGNYLDIGHLDEIAVEFNSRGYSVLAMDYRGYGLSQGKAKETNTYQDSQVVYDYALSLGHKPENIIILGRSVGTGIATELAVNNLSKALILISPYTSTYRVMTKYPVMLFDKFNNSAKINQVKVPILMVHGEKDKVIPAWHSQELYDNYKGPKSRHVIPQAGHNDVWHYDLDLIFYKFERLLKP